MHIQVKKTSAYKNIISYRTRFSNLKEDLEIINLGSTSAYYAFDYRMIKKNGANLAMPPQTLSYDFKILKEYSYCLKEHAIVCICICPFSFLVTNYKHDHYNLKYYGILKRADIIGCTCTKEFLWNYFPALLKPSLLKSMFFDEPLNNEKLLQPIISKAEDKAFSEKMMRSWEYEFGWDKRYLISEDQLQTMQKVVKILLQIVEYCLENQYRPVVVIPPMSSNLVNLISKKLFKKCLFDNLNQLKNYDLPIMNGLDMADLCEYDNYYNAICLNDKGKALFHQKLNTFLETVNLL